MISQWLRLPKTATAPFCPSEVQGSISIPENASSWKKWLLFAGPGLLISVGYMDPGNWATDIEAGSRYGYNLLIVVFLSSLAAILLQFLSMKLGLVTGRDLAQLCRERYPKPTTYALWILAELAIIATDVAEVLGGALAFHLLLGCSLTTGVGITALDTLIVLGLKGKGFRQVEAIILGLVATIGLCYAVELLLAKPDWQQVVGGFFPARDDFQETHSWYLAVGILGATVMPHNLYLHSSIVQTRRVPRNEARQREALRFSTGDTVISLSLAFFVNAAILVLAAAVFHMQGHQDVAEIDDAFHLLSPLVGPSAAGFLFALALLAAGQSSTFTGTIAGQILLDGFLKLKIPCWKRRLITRGLALIPAWLGVLLLGEGSTGKLLVFSQVVLSLQLPFAIFPLIRLTSDRQVMGVFQNSTGTRILAWLLFFLISGANLWLLYRLAFGL